MKKLLIFFALFLSIKAASQTLDTRITGGRNYTNVNITANGARAITGPILNTDLNKIFDLFKYIDTANRFATFHPIAGSGISLSGVYPNITFTSMGGIDTTGKLINYIYRRHDSVFFSKNGVSYYAFKDSTGGSSTNFANTDLTQSANRHYNAANHHVVFNNADSFKINSHIFQSISDSANIEALNRIDIEALGPVFVHNAINGGFVDLGTGGLNHAVLGMGSDKSFVDVGDSVTTISNDSLIRIVGGKKGISLSPLIPNSSYRNYRNNSTLDSMAIPDLNGNLIMVLKPTGGGPQDLNNVLGMGGTFSTDRSANLGAHSLTLIGSNPSDDVKPNLIIQGTEGRFLKLISGGGTPFSIGSADYPGVNDDGSANHVWNFGFNMLGNGGRIDYTKTNGGMSWEQDYQAPGQYHQSELHWFVTDTSGRTQRLVSFQARITGAYTEGFITADRFYYKQRDQAATFNPNGYFDVRNDPNTNQTDLILRGLETDIDIQGLPNGVNFLKYNGYPILSTITDPDTSLGQIATLNIGTNFFAHTSFYSPYITLGANGATTCFIRNNAHGQPMVVDDLYTNAITFSTIDPITLAPDHPEYQRFAFKNVDATHLNFQANDVDYSVPLSLEAFDIKPFLVPETGISFDTLSGGRIGIRYSPSASTAWTQGGNSGTNPSTDFIGTTDAANLIFRTNNIVAAGLSQQTIGGAYFYLPGDDNTYLYIKAGYPDGVGAGYGGIHMGNYGGGEFYYSNNGLFSAPSNQGFDIRGGGGTDGTNNIVVSRPAAAGSGSVFIAKQLGQDPFFALNTTGADGDMALGSGAASNPTSILTATSTTKGILITRLTTEERNAITTPAAGLMLINTTKGYRLEVSDGTTWHSSSRVSTSTAAPTTTPSMVGDIHVDTSAKKLYFATGTTSSADWEIAN